MSDTVQNVFASDCTYRTTLTAPQNGFYNVDFCYSHSNWDTWMKLDIVGENGETVSYIPPLPRKYTKTTMLLYLFKGVNRIIAAPRYDQPTLITDIYVSEKVPQLTPTVTPTSDYLYLDAPLPRRLMVISYTGAPLMITKGDTHIPFELEDKTIYDDPNAVEEIEPFNYYHVKLSADALSALAEGVHELKIVLPEDKSVSYKLHVSQTASACNFKIVSLDVNHGNSVLLRLPNGKNLLIDTGTQRCAEEVLFPYFDAHGITPDYLLITHYHGDHMGCLDEVLSRYPRAIPDKAGTYIGSTEDERGAYLSQYQYLDCSMLRRYDRLDRIWDLGGVEVTVLNSHFDENGNAVEPEGVYSNGSSVSLLVHYKGFQYYHGADNHAHEQQENLRDFTAWGKLDELRCHYMQANHHFHGDMYPEMIRAINPVAVLVPASAAIYARSAFMVDYLQSVVGTEFPGKRLKETFVSYFSGTVTVFVNSGDDWHYETC